MAEKKGAGRWAESPRHQSPPSPTGEFLQVRGGVLDRFARDEGFLLLKKEKEKRTRTKDLLTSSTSSALFSGGSVAPFPLI